MTSAAPQGASTHWLLRKEDLAALLRALREDGYRLAGPSVRDGAIVCDEIDGIESLPCGWSDTQAPGRYRLKRRQDEALFGHVVGPQSWKRYLLPPHVRLFTARREGRGFVVVDGGDEPGPEHLERERHRPDLARVDSAKGHEEKQRSPRDDPETSRAEPGNDSGKLALIGVRACEIAAMRIQDRILRGGAYTDPHYASRRGGVFVVAVNCTAPGGTCFCASMDTGPRVTDGFDLALTEILDSGDHRFLVEIGTEAGRALLARAGGSAPSEADVTTGEASVQAAARTMGRALDTRDIKALLYDNAEHPRWDEVASRCLACGNCTMVCPTCFCTTVEDATDLSGELAERVRRWDSCFTAAFSYIHGGSVRSSVKSRYRQWMTHKLASWIDQFGTSGCVGCGRCITWCPAGIDITEEVAAIRAAPEGSGHRRKE